jgi:hypothetical protein
MHLRTRLSVFFLRFLRECGRSGSASRGVYGGRASLSASTSLVDATPAAESACIARSGVGDDCSSGVSALGAFFESASPSGNIMVEVVGYMVKRHCCP